MLRVPPLVNSRHSLTTRTDWTTLYLEENPHRRFGADTASSCAGSAQFRQIPIRDFRKCAAERFLDNAEADAAAARIFEKR
jgi:hypothetical protein